MIKPMKPIENNQWDFHEELDGVYNHTMSEAEAFKRIESFISNLLNSQKEKINMEIRKLSGQWEGKSIEWIEGNKKAFSDILKILK